MVSNVHFKNITVKPMQRNRNTLNEHGKLKQQFKIYNYSTLVTYRPFYDNCCTALLQGNLVNFGKLVKVDN